MMNAFFLDPKRSLFASLLLIPDLKIAFFYIVCFACFSFLEVPFLLMYGYVYTSKRGSDLN